jgi:hypothetical protein
MEVTVVPPPIPPRTSEWKRTEPFLRVPNGFLPQLTHAQNDAIAMGWRGPIIFLMVTISSTFYLIYQGILWSIDKIKSRN